MLLNGKPVTLNGFGRHEDFIASGKGLNLPLMVKDYGLMRWTGANSYRTSHYPYSEEEMQLADREGFELVGGRLLPDGPGKSAQLMYQNAAGTRVTVYLRKPEAGADAAFRYERHGELGLFYWVESGAGYALVGALPREDLLALAEAIYRQKPEMPGAASAPAS
mgnify:CR=1 FL=1